MKKISVVLPCLNEEKNLAPLTKEIIKQIPAKYTYELIFVNDGSSDGTEDEIKKLAKNNKGISGISMYRRFGHQAALLAGINFASGEAIITMDSDFQHPPKVLSTFIKHWEKGFDLIQGQKKTDRTSDFVRNIQRKIGYSVWNIITGGVITPGISDFRLMSKKVAEYVRQNNESQIFLRGVVTLAANNPKIVKYNVGKRKFGKSSYTTKMFVNMFLNGFISFSNLPLRMAWVVGIIIFVLAGGFFAIDTLIALLQGRSIIQGWITVISLLLILNGLILIYLGIIGEYIGVIFMEVKGRPKYIVKEFINLRQK